MRLGDIGKDTRARIFIFIILLDVLLINTVFTDDPDLERHTLLEQAYQGQFDIEVVYETP